jgi:hypothetical protein
MRKYKRTIPTEAEISRLRKEGEFGGALDVKWSEAPEGEIGEAE